MALRMVPIEQISSLTFEQANSYLEHKDAEHSCGACGAEDWRMASGEDGKVVLLMLDVVGRIGSIPFIPVHCGNCDNTRLFNAISVFEWVAEQEARNGDQKGQ